MRQPHVQLTPDPHLLRSFINRGLSWAKIISEFVDNGFDTAAGNAEKVVIGIDRTGVSVTDYGRGIEDINRLGQLGASTSYNYSNNIGQYGVGGKGWLCKAHSLDVLTVRDGRKHAHTFNVRRALKTAGWLNAYNGKGRPTSDPTFTIVLMRDIHANAGPIHIDALISELQKNYWPGLLQGREIHVIDHRPRNRQPIKYVVPPLEPPNWSDKIAFESSVNGRKYSAVIGLLSDNVGAYSGLWMGYLFRNICKEKSLPNRAFPPRVHGQITLSDDWRTVLSNYKDELIHDREELLADIEEKAKAILDLADEYAQDLHLDNVMLEIDARARDAMRNIKGSSNVVPFKAEKEETGERERRERTEPRPAPEIKPPQGDPAKWGDDECDDSGLKYRWERLGTDVLDQVSITGREITVTLNKDCPKLMALTEQPRYPGIYLAIGSALSEKAMELRVQEIDSLFGAMLGTATGSQDKPMMIKAIRCWWGFLAAEAERDAA